MFHIYTRCVDRTVLRQIRGTVYGYGSILPWKHNSVRRIQSFSGDPLKNWTQQALLTLFGSCALLRLQTDVSHMLTISQQKAGEMHDKTCNNLQEFDFL